MLVQAATTIKALNEVIARPFVATAERFRHQGQGAPSAGNAARFTATFARSRREVIEAQRLRFRVFSEEYGAAFNSPLGLDRDRFDKHCLHLLVRDTATGELVGYTRLLSQANTARTGGFYSSSEFHMGMANSLQGRVAEIGRTCIHPEYRGGAVITVLWSRLAQYMVEQDIQHLIGCASVSLAEHYDVGAIVSRIRAHHLSELGQRVAPRRQLPLTVPADNPGKVAMPPLLKAYLRMGARVCGEPAWDPDFNCLDFFILLQLQDLPARYVQHFLQPAMAVAS